MPEDFAVNRPMFAPNPGEPEITTMNVPPKGQPEDMHVARRVAKSEIYLFDGDWVMVQNCDTHPLEFAWARRKWVVMPGETKPVMFEAAVDKLGDPRSVEGAVTHYDDGNGNRGVVPERYNELTKLMARYGVREERIFDHVDEVTKERTLGLLSLAPKVNVTTMDGKPLTFPCQRHDMLPYPVPNLNPERVNSDMSRMIDAVTAENDDLRERVNQLEELVNRRLGAAASTIEE
jgi:hypothetical protein